MVKSQLQHPSHCYEGLHTCTPVTLTLRSDQFYHQCGYSEGGGWTPCGTYAGRHWVSGYYGWRGYGPFTLNCGGPITLANPITVTIYDDMYPYGPGNPWWPGTPVRNSITYTLYNGVSYEISGWLLDHGMGDPIITPEYVATYPALYGTRYRPFHTVASSACEVRNATISAYTAQPPGDEWTARW